MKLVAWLSVLLMLVGLFIQAERNARLAHNDSVALFALAAARHQSPPIEFALASSLFPDSHSTAADDETAAAKPDHAPEEPPLTVAPGSGPLIWSPALPRERSLTLYVADGCEPCHRLKALLENELRSETIRYNLVLHNLSERASTILREGTQTPQLVIRDRDSRVIARMETWNGVSDDELARWLRVHAATWPEYPVGNRPWWTGCDSWRHLTEGEHAGKFHPAWLRAQSNASLQSLHSDDHENSVNWDRIVTPFGPPFKEN